ncbi:MAG: hypothetical protein MJ061_04795 [Mailhella sp.]|nr:hypothetical protein [Mailhella sp.]
MIRLIAHIADFLSAKRGIHAASHDGEYAELLTFSPAMRNADCELGSVWAALNRELSGSQLRELLHSQHDWLRHGRRKAARRYMSRGYAAASAYTMATDERIDTIRSFFAKQRRQYAAAPEGFEHGPSTVLGLPVSLGMPKDEAVRRTGALPRPGRLDELTVPAQLFEPPAEISLIMDSYLFTSADEEPLRRLADCMGITSPIVRRCMGGAEAFTFEERPAYLSCVETSFSDAEVENRLFEHFCEKYTRIAKHDNMLFDAPAEPHGNTGAFIADDRYLYCRSRRTPEGPRMTIRYIDRQAYESKSRCRDLFTMAGSGDISIALYENGSFCGFPWGTPMRDIIRAFPGRSIAVGEGSLKVHLLSYPHTVDVTFRFDDEMRLIWGDLSLPARHRSTEGQINAFFSRKYAPASEDAMLTDFVHHILGRKAHAVRCYAFEDDRVVVMHANGLWHIVRGRSEDMAGELGRRHGRSGRRARVIESELVKF